MTHGWGGRTRPSGWTTTRNRILKRDAYRCYLCGTQATEVDHVINAASGGSHDDSNLAAICATCHEAKTKREAAAARQPRRRPIEKHPGLL